MASNFLSSFARWLRSLFSGTRRVPPRDPRASRLGLESLDGRITPAVFHVTTGADDGPGSLRDALDLAADAPSIDTVLIHKKISTVALESPLVYSGAEFLTIRGHNTTIRPVSGSEGAFDLFESTGGAGLTLERLAFTGGLNGVEVVTPADRTIVLSVWLNHVTITGNAGHGLVLDDIAGSEASLYLSVLNSSFDGNDLDGVRITEAGAGDIVAWFYNSSASNNGGNGVRLDESGGGVIDLTAVNLSAFDNGGFALDLDEDGGGIFTILKNLKTNDPLDVS